MEEACPSESLVSYHNTTPCRNPEDYDMNFHRRENLRFHTEIWNLNYPIDRNPSWEANSCSISRKFPPLWNLDVIIVFYSIRHAIPYWDRWIQPIFWYPIPSRSISILSYHLLLVLPSGPLFSCLPTETLYAPLAFSIRATCCLSPWIHHPYNIQ
jgi:hypothetical protein